VKEIPFYEECYLIKPGLSGWAQVKYRYSASVEDTKEKLFSDKKVFKDELAIKHGYHNNLLSFELTNPF